MFLKRTFLFVPLLLSLTLFVGCGGDETGLSGGHLDLTYITDDFSSAVIIHPARLLESDFVKELEKAGVPIDEEMQGPIQEAGIDPRKIEQMIVLLDEDTISSATDMMPMGGGGGLFGGGPRPRFEDVAEKIDSVERPQEEIAAELRDQGSLATAPEALQTVAFQPGAAFGEGEAAFGEDHGPGLDMPQPPVPTMIVRFTEDVDTSTFLDKKQGAPLEDADVDGLKVKKATDSEAVFHFPNKKTLIITKPGLLKKMVETKSAESDLITELKNVDAGHDFIIVFDLMPFRQQLQQASQMMQFMLPPDKKALGRIPTKTKMLTVAGGLSSDALMSITLVMDSADDASAVNDVLTDTIKEGREKYDKQKSAGLPPGMPLDEAQEKEFVQMVDEIVAGVSNTADDNKLTISIPKPSNFNKLAAMMTPAIKDARKAAQLAQQKNHLKQIGLAFHNYHDVYNGFPSAGSDASGEQQGLSWRVHLLPYLDHRALYEQFHLDEPWDSEHNKALISQMPDVFETPDVNGDGKTVFHVVVDEKTAFQMDKSLKIRDLTDGTANTILVIQAGPDKADVWTKPGGLEFNESDPITAFGNVGEQFLALLADGRVRVLSRMIAPDTLKALLTRNAGDIPQDF